MRRNARFILVFALLAVALGGCGSSDEAAAPGDTLNVLARHVPVTGDPVYFLDLNPGPELAPHWDRARRRLAETPTGQILLAQLQDAFQANLFDLRDILQGPAVSGRSGRASYVIYQVADEAGALEAMLDSQGDASAWERATHQGKLLYHGWVKDALGESLYVAWTIDDSLLFLAHDRSIRALEALGDLLDLIQANSLADLPAWQTVRDELPDPLLGLLFFPVPETGGPSLTSSQPPLSEILNQNLAALALALQPQDQGLRIELHSLFRPGAETVPALRDLASLSTVEPQAWQDLPANTAVAISSHSASVLWPWAQDLFGLDLASLLTLGTGLDIETDLATDDGLLSGAFGLAVSPPLPGQPLVDTLPAIQLVLAAPDATPAQADRLRATLEARGAVWSSDQVEGIDIQKQVGTAAAGYALAYGFDGGVFYLGSSPQALAGAFAARRDGQGLAGGAAIQAVAPALPDDASLVAFLDVPTLFELVQANAPAEDIQANETFQILSAFEAVGLGFRFRPDRIDGVLYLYMPD